MDGPQKAMAGWLAGTEEECVDMARLTAMPTHNHPEGIKGAMATALAVYHLKSGRDKAYVRSCVLEHFYPDWALQVCDLDGDGHQDLLLTIDKTKQTTYAFIIFLRNQGDGTFKKSEQGMEGEYTFHEVVYLDGKPGLTAVKKFINSQGYQQYDFYLFQWDANFNLNETMLLPEGYMLSNPENPFVADLNGDGKLDFLVTPNTIEHYLYTPENAKATKVAAPLCLSLWLIQDSNWKGRVLWKLFGGLATILQNWISCNEQKMREAHITRRGTSFYLLIFIEKIINRKIEHSQKVYSP